MVRKEEFERTERLLGADSLTKLQNARVAVFGVGGVGGYVVEALARSGVGTLDLIDNDDVALSNINRQIIALHSTVGMPKVEGHQSGYHGKCPSDLLFTGYRPSVFFCRLRLRGGRHRHRNR